MTLLYRKKLMGYEYRTYSGTEQEFFQSKDGENCFKVKQIHSKTLISLQPEMKKSASALIEADGLVVLHRDWQGAPLPHLQILTADCLPVAVIGKNGHAHLHAGWRGLQQNILDQDQLLALDPVLFFMGPAIGTCCYEVQADFKNNFQSFAEYPFLQECFFERKQKYIFDLLHFASAQILTLYPQATVLSSGICTFCDTRFASFRRDKPQIRNQNILVPL